MSAPSTPSDHRALRRVADVCGDEADILALSVARFVAAGYMTSDVACWNAAFDGAEQLLGATEGCRFVACVVAIVRALRAEREDDWSFMPASCCRVTGHECALVNLINRGRRRLWTDLEEAAAELTGREADPVSSRRSGRLSERSMRRPSGWRRRSARLVPFFIRTSRSERLSSSGRHEPNWRWCAFRPERVRTRRHVDRTPAAAARFARPARREEDNRSVLALRVPLYRRRIGRVALDTVACFALSALLVVSALAQDASEKARAAQAAAQQGRDCRRGLPDHHGDRQCQGRPA